MSEPQYAGFLPGAHAIEGYGAGGFRFGGMSHRGSILALPSGVYAWAAAIPAEITIDRWRPCSPSRPAYRASPDRHGRVAHSARLALRERCASRA